MAGKWLVKLARGKWETVLGTYSTRDNAKSEADALNISFQTDEYYVEEFQLEKIEGYVINQDELRERIAKAIATGIVGGWGDKAWNSTTSGLDHNYFRNAAHDVLLALPELTE
jgi:tRNA A37 threonylcarbamoyladenosine modification protein TsaB